jgi:hypothetical protein
MNLINASIPRLEVNIAASSNIKQRCPGDRSPVIGSGISLHPVNVILNRLLTSATRNVMPNHY